MFLFFTIGFLLEGKAGSYLIVRAVKNFAQAEALINILSVAPTVLLSVSNVIVVVLSQGTDEKIMEFYLCFLYLSIIQDF